MRPKLGRKKQRAHLPTAIRSDGDAIVRIYRGRRLIQSGKQICADVTDGCAGFLHTVQHIGDMETVKLTKPFTNGGNGDFLAADTDAGLCRAERIGQQLDDGFDGFFVVLCDQNIIVQFIAETLSAIAQSIDLHFPAALAPDR